MSEPTREHRIESLKAGQCPKCKSSLCIEENPRNLTIKCDAECGWSARYPIRTIRNSEPRRGCRECHHTDYHESGCSFFESRVRSYGPVSVLDSERAQGDETKILVSALWELASCDLNDSNCASVEIAGNRVRTRALKALQDANVGGDSDEPQRDESLDLVGQSEREVIEKGLLWLKAWRVTHGAEWTSADIRAQQKAEGELLDGLVLLDSRLSDKEREK